MDKNIVVSILIVVRNAEPFILQSIKSLINQGFEKEKYEIIIVDGLSSDCTITVAKQYLDKNDINHKILKNKQKTLASGWNLGIKASSGYYIVRPDAHAELLDGYIKTGIEKLENDKLLASVGGVLITKSSSYIGKMIARVLSNSIGVGASLFRIGVKKDTYSDTAVYAVYRKKIFDEVGFFDELLQRNQDVDLHRKISKKGYKFLTTPDMTAIYYSRTSLKKFIRQAFDNGFWVTYGVSGHFRHLIPMFFVFAIFISIFIKLFFYGLFMLYICVVFLAYIVKSKEYNPINLLVLLGLTFTLHVSYGIGSLIGLVKKIFKGKIDAKNS